MASFTKAAVIITSLDNGLPDTAFYTMEFCSINGTYPDDAIACTHRGNGLYTPVSAIQDNEHYDVYVNGIWFNRYFARKAIPATEL